MTSAFAFHLLEKRVIITVDGLGFWRSDSLLYHSESRIAGMASARASCALYHLVLSSYLKKEGEVLGMSLKKRCPQKRMIPRDPLSLSFPQNELDKQHFFFKIYP